MDNDDKIKELSLFLGDELEPLRRSKKVQVYDLETEYAKTRHNRLWSVWVTLGLTFVVFVLVTVFTIRGIGKSNDKIDVNLSSFEDLNLQNLFNQLEKAQEQFDEAVKRRASLQGALDARLDRAKQKMLADLDLLKRTSLSKSALAARRQKIQSDYNRELALYNDHMLSKADLELAESNLANAKANVKAAQAALDLAKLDLAYTEVKSPVSGRIGKALMTKGNLATAGASRLARVVQMDPIRVVFSITDKDNKQLY